MSPRDLRVRAAAETSAALRGIIARREPFVVTGHTVAAGCTDWGAVAAGGYACLDGATVSTDPPVPLPRVLYGDLPYLYGKGVGAAPGMYSSVSAWAKGLEPRAPLVPGFGYHFLKTTPSSHGEVAVRDDGTIVPMSMLHLYRPSSLAGRDLSAEPLPPGAVLGFCLEKKGCDPVPFQGSFVLQVPEVLPPGAVTLWHEPPPAPADVAPGELWIDVNQKDQVLTILRDGVPLYVTLVSSGLGGEHATPNGTWRLTGKTISNNMESLPNSPDNYLVEEVPWVMHFLPRYALHGAFWHDRFGHKKSHGCVNLAPTDAHRIFQMVSPQLPDGWRSVEASPETPGTVVRIR